MPDYLSEPSTSGPHPGVVVLHESFGVNDDIRAKADRLASRGYLALAPDLLVGGPRIVCLVSAFRALATGKGSQFELIDAARATLAGRADCTGKVGVVGFCLGGGFALLCAPRFDFAAAAPNYGVVPSDPERTLADACPIVASYGRKDLSLRGAAAKLDAALTSAGVVHDVKEYPEAGHSFLSHYTSGLPRLAERIPGVQYHGPSAADAWERIDAFFDEHVKTAG